MSNNTKDDDRFDANETPFRYLAYFNRLARFQRYLAFTSDVGEAFRPVLSSKLVNLSYGISFAYVGFDIGNEGYTSWKRKDTSVETARIVIERSIFQGLASLFLPAITIHTLVDTASKQFKKHNCKPQIQRWGPSALGLATLPLLPIVFDEPVEHGLQTLFQKVWPITSEQQQKFYHHHQKTE